MRASSLLRSRLARSAALAVLAALGFTTAGWSFVSISSTATPSFSVLLNGADQTPTYLLPFTVSSNNSYNGWHVNASATQFVNGTFTFPTGASRVLAVALPSGCHFNCLSQTGSIVYPVALPETGGVSIFSAASNNADGTNTLTATVQVATPANVHTGVYTSTVTLQAVSGP